MTHGSHRDLVSASAFILFDMVNYAAPDSVGENEMPDTFEWRKFGAVHEWGHNMGLDDHLEAGDQCFGSAPTVMDGWVNFDGPVCPQSPTVFDVSSVGCRVYAHGCLRGMEVKQEAAYGLIYQTPFFWPDAADNAQSVVSVIARENDTAVSVIDGVGGNGFQVVDLYGNILATPTGTWSETLHSGWVRQYRSTSPAARMIASRPIQVVAWNNEFGWTRGMDLHPESAWGSSYRTPAFWDSPSDNANSVVSIVARDNNTTVTVQDGTGWNGFQVVTLWGDVINVGSQSWSGVLQAGWVIQLRNTSPAAMITSGANAIQVSAWNNERGWIRGMSLRWDAIGWGTAYRSPAFFGDPANNQSSVISVVARDPSTAVTVQDGWSANGFQVVDLWGNTTNAIGTWSGTLQAGWIIQFRNTSPSARVTANKPIQVVAWNNEYGWVRGMNLLSELTWGTAYRSPAFWADAANNQSSVISVVARDSTTQVTAQDGIGGNGFQVVDLYGTVIAHPTGSWTGQLQAGQVLQFRNMSPAARVTADKPIQVLTWNNE